MLRRDTPYPPVPARPDLPRIEQRIIDFWARDATFRTSVDRRREGSDDFIFYDGPPFANELPHYGHLLTGYVKDAIPRYRTMLGARADRRFGWDCHGLPAEMVAVSELGVSTRADVERFGVSRFNDHCRSSVLRFAGEWERYVNRQARWVDVSNAYRTMDRDYMESVLWAFKRLWERELIYEGMRVLPYCTDCETPLSNFETRLDDAYRMRKDPAVTVLFPMEAPEGLSGPLHAVAWTTTPWTLPSNLALAVHPDLDYAVVELGGVRYVLAAELVGAHARELGEARPVAALKGSELVGLRYDPPFDFFRTTPGAFRVLGATFVSTEEGTGVVHLAPGFGEEDRELCARHGIPVVCPVDDLGRFTSEVGSWAGSHVLDVNAEVAQELATRGLVLRAESIDHLYPHCWRTDTPLIYRALSSWFLRVTAVKDRLLELAEEITWVPESAGAQFASWLAGARDWCISRNRFWGAPIPVWRSDDPDRPRTDVYGSLDEIERDFGVRPDDLHRPGVDELVRADPDDPSGRSRMRRVPEVLDCWFESGSMPFAQVHHPFEQGFERRFPADFVCEYVGQARAWFYNLHVLATALFDRPAFRTAVVHGVLLGEDGRKLSKRLRNYPDPGEVFDDEGSDALRWSLLSSPALGGQEMVVRRDDAREALRRVIHPLWSTWHFLSLYASADAIAPRRRTDASGLLDRYVLAETRELVAEVRRRMDAYDVRGACAAIESFLEVLTNWYVRRSRRRFWRAGQDADKQDAYDTLHTVIEVLCRASAPLLPLVTEEIYRALTGARSVHLEDFPDPDDLPADDGLVEAMRGVRAVCSAVLGIRREHGLRVRLPLPQMTIAGQDANTLEPFVELVADETNVKRIELLGDPSALGEERLHVDLPRVGPRLGPNTTKVLAAASRGDWRLLPDGTAEVGGQVLAPEEWTVNLEPRDPERTRPLAQLGVLVSLETETTPELEAEGLARDVVRLVQVARREAGLEVADRARVRLDGAEEVLAAVSAHDDHVAEETLADELELGELGPEAPIAALPNGQRLRILVRRAGRGSSGLFLGSGVPR